MTTTTIEEAVKSAIEQAIPNAAVTPDPTPAMPPHVAANICKMLERVPCTGMEAIAWVEAYHIMQRLANQGPGVPFVPPK